MDFLLDTHTALWHLLGSNKISALAKSIIEERANRMYVSTASIWEMTIKKSLNKLEFDFTLQFFQEKLDQSKFDLKEIRFEHLIVLEKLPFHHRDPFDRMMIAQAISENLTVITKDPEFKKYPVKILW